MRRLFQCGFVAAVLVVAADLFAQYAKEIPRGSTTDDVVRAYGWPKGRSSTGQREVWSYDQFQVSLEAGRVVDVRVLEQPKKPGQSKVRIQPVPGATAAPVQANRVPAPAPANAARASRSPIVVLPQAATPAGAARTPEPSRRPVPQQKPTGVFASVPLWTFPVFLALLGLGGAIITHDHRVRKEEARARAEAARQGVQRSSGPKSWQDEIAERLRATNSGSPTTAPAVPVTPADLSALTIDLLQQLEWKRFELIVARYYSAIGRRAELTCAGADGGVDIKLFRDGEEQPHCYVQCKAWGDNIGVAKVRELRGVMGNAITEGVFATTSDFWPDALSFAQQNGIEAVNGSEFVRRFQALPVERRTAILTEVTAGDYTTPSCPRCESKMVWKPNPKFWACPRYPKCRSKPIYPRGD